MNKQQAEQQLNALYEKEKELEKALEHVREMIRENINFLDKNKVK